MRYKNIGKSMCLMLALLMLTGCMQQDLQESTVQYNSTTTEATSTAADTSQTLSTTATQTEASTTVETTAATTESASDISILSRNQALADYDYMWHVLNENYPSFDVAFRMYGVSKETVHEEGRVEITQYEQLSLPQFFDICTRTLEKFEHVFHLGMINVGSYNEMKVLTEANPDLLFHSFKTITDWEKCDYAYATLSRKSMTTTETTPITAVPVIRYEYSNVSYETINDDTALITINSFGISSQEQRKAKERLLNFYNMSADVKNLIIDISENGGGGDLFWMDYIVSPNITERIEQKILRGAKGGKVNKDLVQGFGLNDDPTIKENLAALPNANQTYLDTLDIFLSSTRVIEPLDPAPVNLFKGKLYVLIDKPVFSASESFAMFCKQTGFATLVGRNSSGDGSSSTPVHVSLPNSGLIFRYTALSAFNDDGSCNQEFGTAPDFLCEAGETPLEACLRVIESQSMVE